MAVTRNSNGLSVRPLVSDTASAVPSAAELLSNEIALNTIDKKLFVKNLSNVVVELDFGSTTVLNDTLNSTSTTEAATANAVKQVNDKFLGLAEPKNAATIAARDALSVDDREPLTIVHVDDDGDGKWARYQNMGTAATPVWTKIADEDALNAGLGATNLSYTASATGGTVTNTSGSDAALPLADATNAGQIVPSSGVVGDMVFATATGYQTATPAAAGSF